MERRLPNGLVVVVQPMPWTRAVQVELVLPVGSVTDPEDAPGCTALLWEWLDRGAGGLDARERQEAFSSLGIRHGGGSGRSRSGLSAALLADVLPQALSLMADEVASPNLEDDAFEIARTHALEALASLEDRPAERLGEALDAHAFRGPFARSAYGTEESLEGLTPSAVRRQRDAALAPHGSVLVIAGGADVEPTFDAVAEAFCGWGGAALPDGEGGRAEGEASARLPAWAPPARHDLPLEAHQTQLGWAWPLLPPDDDRAPAQSLGHTVLSGGMGARLFREVRETRGLAYAVSASTVGVRGAAWGTAYAGTTPERTEETLAVVTSELARLRRGVDEDELERARTGLRTREAVRGESSAGRAGQLMQDLVLLGHARRLEERVAAFERPDLAAVNAALAAAPEVEPTVVVLGPSTGGDGRGEPERRAPQDRVVGTGAR